MTLQPHLLGLDWSARVDRRVAAAARAARSLTFVGTGTSLHCALWATWLARAHGVAARAISTWDHLASRAEAAPGELTVVISHRGNKNLTRKLLSRLGRARVLVCGKGAPAGRHPAVFTSPQEVSGAHTMSLVGAMAAVSELIAFACGANGGRRVRSQRKTAAALLALGAESSRKLPARLAPGSGLHFIGGGAFHPIALELALKAREMARIPAHAYNTEEFLHGPLASVKRGDTVILLPPLRKLGPAPLGYLYNERASACENGARSAGARVFEPLWERGAANLAARLDPEWQAVLALQWGQLFCLRTALQRGINPDRYARSL